MTTDCAIERNGTKHSGKKAYKHMKRKYKYFRDEITSTETFIEYAGTKSTMSDKYYIVHCEGEDPRNTQDWLLEELKRYRESNMEPASKKEE